MHSIPCVLTVEGRPSEVFRIVEKPLHFKICCEPQTWKQKTNSELIVLLSPLRRTRVRIFGGGGKQKNSWAINQIPLAPKNANLMST